MSLDRRRAHAWASAPGMHHTDATEPARVGASPGQTRKSLDEAGDPVALDVRPRQAEFLDPVSHLVAIDSEQGAGVGLVAARALERLHQQLTLHLFEVHAVGRQAERGAPTYCATTC